MIVIGIGSNMGDRLLNLNSAIRVILERSILYNITCSSIYESEALLPQNASPEWQINFLNMAIRGESSYSAPQLLIEIKKIEKELGRQASQRWAPREMDLDILCYDDLVLSTDQLTVPHADLLLRNFALQPLAEIWPDWRYPVPGDNLLKSANELASKLDILQKKVEL